ncbi:hypothetical protein N340_06867, partial [Tauraco erythrolophus]
QRKSTQEYMGILCSLIMRDKLPLDDIKASVTEMMAGGVDTVRSGQGQRAGRRFWLVMSCTEVGRGRAGLSPKRGMWDLSPHPRLHPVAVTLQRYTTQEVILQDYRIPPKTLVQVGLYAMGRDAEVFPKPEQFNPQRWLAAGP